jgi:hypothetical protein
MNEHSSLATMRSALWDRHLTSQYFDFTGGKMYPTTYPILLANPHVRFYWTFISSENYRGQETPWKGRARTSIA